ncbi:hypothetical protein PJI21_29405, partial [Mycobacterium kansasii]
PFLAYAQRRGTGEQCLSVVPSAGGRGWCGLNAFWANFDTFLTPNWIGFVPKLKIRLVTYKYMM